MAPATTYDYPGYQASPPRSASGPDSPNNHGVYGPSIDDASFSASPHSGQPPLGADAYSLGNGYNARSPVDGESKGLACEPIAIIGMGCRLPGGASSASKLWDLLKQAKSAQGRFPPSRFNIDGFYHPDSDRPGSLSTAGGYFIDEDIRAFENAFFGINNLEATYMDPQQRKLLEVVFECFENAGQSLEMLSGSNVGCYVGNFVTDFITMQLKDAEYTHRYSATGLGTTILANRISHVFNLKGPSFVIDTACSSSLYCLHAACTALQQGECDSAIVAGANLIQSPEQQLATMKAGVLSKTSTCHTFDSSADGYGRADGIGALLVKRLSDALRDNDPIRAVVRGTAVNSNGKTNGITLPSSDGQEAVIRKAYAQAGLEYGETDYVECHGTGTAVGDPIEVEAVSRVFKRPADRPLLIGSVKTNLGHSEAASGISSIIKVVLALEKKEIPPTIGVASLNPKLKLDDWNIRIVSNTTPWPRPGWADGPDGHVRRAGINSFGYGGANAHAILEAADAYLVPPSRTSRPVGQNKEADVAVARARFLLPVSASNTSTLQRRVSELGSALDLSSTSVVDLAYTLGVRRSHLPVRGFMLARPGHLGQDVAVENLQTRLDGRPYSRLPIAFVFTGQGAQWAEMGRELIAEFASFRRTIQTLDSTLQLLPHPPSWTLLAALLEPAETSMINDASRSQPVCTAVQIALVRLLAAFGITPESVVGHSSGEIAAAYAKGLVTAEQAITVAYYRGYTVTRSPNAKVGAMMAAGLGRSEAADVIRELGLEDEIVVACVNSPESVTISGEITGINTLKAHLDERGTFARVLKTNGKAYHSHQMSAVGQEYEDYLSSTGELGGLAVKGRVLPPAPVRWISSVTGNDVVGEAGPAYWRANLESPVLFSDVVEKLLQTGPQHLIEIGPHSALELPIKQVRTKLNMAEDKVHYGSALYRGKNSVDTVLQLVGNLYLHGHTLSFDDVNAVESWVLKAQGKPERRQGTMIRDLPGYTWDYDPQHELFNEPRVSVEWRNRKHPRHDLLGSQVHGGDGILTQWRNVLRAKDIPWVEGHKLDTTIVCPAACYLAMAIEAARQVTDAEEALDQGHGFRLWDVNITKALVLPPQEAAEPGVEVFTTLQPCQLPGGSRADWYQFHISSYGGGEATPHATGLIQLVAGSDSSSTTVLPVKRPEDMEPTAPRTWYNRFAQGGLVFEDDFQSLSQIHVHRKRDQMQVLAETKALGPFATEGGDLQAHGSRYLVHPVAIDAIFQAGIIASTSGNVRDLLAKVPVHIDQLVVSKPASSPAKAGQLNIQAVSEPVGFGTINVSGELADAAGKPVVQVSQCRQVLYQSGARHAGASSAAEDERHPMLRVIWKPDITRLGAGDEAVFSSYVAESLARSVPPAADEDQVALARLEIALDLVAHKSSGLRVLALLVSDEEEESLVGVLGLKTAFKRCQSLWRGTFAEDWAIEMKQYTASETKTGTKTSRPDADFDLVILGGGDAAAKFLGEEKALASIRAITSGSGRLLYNASASWVTRRASSLLLQTQLRGSTETILASIPGTQTPDEQEGLKVDKVLIVEGSTPDPLADALVSGLARTMACRTERVSLAQVTPDLVKDYRTVISTVELHEPVLSRVTHDEMRLVKHLTDHSATLVWVTGGRLLQGARPEMGVVFGLSRALMMEQPSLRFFPIDVDLTATVGHAGEVGVETAARHINAVLQQALVEEPAPDFEFVSAAGALHVSRFVPDETVNRVFREKQGGENVVVTLREARPCHLDIGTVGQTGSIFYRHEEAHGDVPLGPGHVEVMVKAAGITAQDLQSISGHASTSGDPVCTSQYAGVVTSVGEEVESLVPGDRVVAMAPGRCATLERVAAWACHKLRDNEDFSTMASIPVPLSTSVYAIQESARLQADEQILICSGGGNETAADLAAVRLAQLAGAQAFVVCSSLEERDRLCEALELPRGRVICAEGGGGGEAEVVIHQLIEATGRQGFDVIVAFSGTRLPIVSTLGALAADRARLVLVGMGGQSLVQTLALDPTALRRNLTCTSVDMGGIVADGTPAGERLRRRLLDQALSLYRQGGFSTLPPSPDIYDISAVGEAFNAVAAGKQEAQAGPGSGVVLSLENDASLVPMRPVKYDTALSPDKTYLLVGCLGGLGRSMSKWMLARGARKFVFLGRSGTDRAPARRLVEDLQAWGAQVTVVRGDVVELEDVQRAVAAIDGPIGGVVQAAMGLGEALFTAMPRDGWLKGLEPKITGSWNLHHAIQGRDQELDFFLMTSSVSGSVGTATESNYCSANYFLDVFARHRRSLGLPATSVGLGMISEVGYLHENPEIEALLLRKGIQAINEDEMLQILDIALSTSGASVSAASGTSYDSMAMGHMLTGLEPLALRAIRAKGFEGTSPVLGDPRAGLLSAALDGEGKAGGGGGGASMGGLAGELAQALEEGFSLGEAVLQMTVGKFSSLVLVPREKLDVGRALSSVGVDSMLAAEFRAWIFSAFKVDVPYLTLLSSSATLTMLSELICTALEGADK